jgi:hypothetical protein
LRSLRKTFAIFAVKKKKSKVESHKVECERSHELHRLTRIKKTPQITQIKKVDDKPTIPQNPNPQPTTHNLQLITYNS